MRSISCACPPAVPPPASSTKHSKFCERDPRRRATHSSLSSGPCSCSGRHWQSSCSRNGSTVAASGTDVGAGLADGAKGADRQVGGNEVGAAPPPRQRLQAIQQRIKQKQAAAAAGGDTAYSLAATQRLVEAAMLAAVSGLSYALATTMHLEGYLGYFLPLPVVLAAMRGGPSAGRKTVTSTFFLLLVLLGPVKALTYVFTHGLMAAVLGYTWCHRFSWGFSVIIGALARIAGQVGFAGVISWVMQENLFSLTVTTSASTFNQMRAWVGIGGSVSQSTVVTGIVCATVINALFYLFFMHMVYMILLTNMGYSLPPPPKIVARFFMGSATDVTAWRP